MPTPTTYVLDPGTPDWIKYAIGAVAGLTMLLSLISVGLIPILLKIITDIKSALAKADQKADSNAIQLVDHSKRLLSLDQQTTDIAKSVPPAPAAPAATAAAPTANEAENTKLLKEIRDSLNPQTGS